MILCPEFRFKIFLSQTHHHPSKEQLCHGITPPLVSLLGVTMKLMDEVAGIVAVRHCKTNIVTASVDAINFHRKIMKGRTPPPGQANPCHQQKDVRSLIKRMNRPEAAVTLMYQAFNSTSDGKYSAEKIYTYHSFYMQCI